MFLMMEDIHEENEASNCILGRLFIPAPPHSDASSVRQTDVYGAAEDNRELEGII